MFKKLGQFIKIVVLIVVITMPIVIYLSIYDINESDLEHELGMTLSSNSLHVVYKDNLDAHKDKYLVVYYEIGRSSGVSLLRKGLNQKYQILDTYYTNDDIACIDYVIDEAPYYIIFGKSNNIVKTLSIETYIKSTSEVVNSKYVFIVKEALFSRGSIKYNYDDETESIKKLNGSININSKSKATLPLFASGLIIFVVLFTMLISSGDKYNISNSDMSYDTDQSFKQMKP